jgi:hypothetical protein
MPRPHILEALRLVSNVAEQEAHAAAAEGRDAAPFLEALRVISDVAEQEPHAASADGRDGVSQPQPEQRKEGLKPVLRCEIVECQGYHPEGNPGRGPFVLGVSRSVCQPGLLWSDNLPGELRYPGLELPRRLRYGFGRG